VEHVEAQNEHELALTPVNSRRSLDHSLRSESALDVG
jgi:hypothetical protein